MCKLTYVKTAVRFGYGMKTNKPTNQQHPILPQSRCASLSNQRARRVSAKGQCNTLWDQLARAPICAYEDDGNHWRLPHIAKARSAFRAFSRMPSLAKPQSSVPGTRKRVVDRPHSAGELAGREQQFHAATQQNASCIFQTALWHNSMSQFPDTSRTHLAHPCCFSVAEWTFGTFALLLGPSAAAAAEAAARSTVRWWCVVWDVHKTTPR